MKPGQVLASRFCIESQIGEGGIGIVYQAKDLRTDQVCAIKVLRPRYARDPRLRRRFMREARAVGRLRHENIVRLLTYGDAAGSPFIAMERLYGRSLSQFAHEEPGLEAVLDLIDQCLAALAYSHARGVIHRDFKPDNVLLVDEAGGLKAKLLDFGFARVEADDDPELTQVHRDAFGTPDYMAPEQAAGDGPITAATDLYAVGAVLHELISGQAPFQGRTPMAIALQQLTAEPPPLVSRTGQPLPEGLAAVVRRAMAKAPRDRYGSANDLRRALTPFRDEAPDFDDRPPISVVSLPDEDSTLVGASVEAVLGTADPFQQAVVGRDLEMAWLWTRVRAVCDEGRGRAVLLGSLPGMGRAVLTGWLRDLVAEGAWMRVVGGLSGPGVRDGHSDLRRILEHLFGDLPAGRDACEAVLRQVAGRWNALAAHPREGLELEELLAAVGALADYLRPRGDTPALRGAVLFQRICDALALAAFDRPVLLTVESVDEAGPVLLDFLQHVAQRAAELSVFVVVTYTLDARDRPVGVARNALVELATTEGVEAIVLDPLDDDALIELLEDTAPIDPLLAQRLADASAGNPLLAVELLATLRQQGQVVDLGGVLVPGSAFAPDSWATSLSAVIVARMRGRLAHLDDGAFIEQVLLRAATLGPVFEYGLLMDFLGRASVETSRAERAVEALLQANLLVEPRARDADWLAFPHAGVAEAALLVAAESGLAMPQLHRLAAEAKEAWFSDRRTVAEGLAEHYVAAGAPLRAAQCLGEAASRAKARGEAEHAVALLSRGARLLGERSGAKIERLRADLWLELAEVELDRGGTDRARALVQRAERWARAAGAPAISARVRHLLADMLAHLDRLADADKWYLSAADQYGSCGEALGRARALLGLAEVRRRAVEPGADLAPVEAAFVQARDVFIVQGEAGGAAPAWLRLGELALAREAPAEAREAFEAALDGFRLTADWAQRAQCHLALADVCGRLGATSLVEAHLDEALGAFAGIGDRGGLARTHARLAQLHAERGAWTDAEAHLNRATTVWVELVEPEAIAQAQAAVGVYALQAGQATRARPLVEAALARALRSGAAEQQIVLCALAGWAAAELGDVAAYRQYLGRAWALENDHEVIDPRLAQAYAATGRVAVRVGDLRPAARLFARAAEIHQALGDLAEADRLRRASDSARRMGEPSTDPPTPAQGVPAAWATPRQRLTAERLAASASPTPRPGRGALPGMEPPSLRPDLALGDEEDESLDFNSLDLAGDSLDLPPQLVEDESVALQAFSTPGPLHEPDLGEDSVEVETSSVGEASSVSPPAHADRAVGRRIGNLRIESRIAVGGMGAVYLARHLALGTPYAVKLLHPSYAADRNTVARFRREAVACSRLRHPHVVFLTDFGLDDALGIYLVMEYLEGEALAERLNRERMLPLGLALDIADQVGHALGAAHDLGIVHRDLKPENVFLVDRGQPRAHVKVLDFGIARLRSEEGERLTGAGLVLGTPDYMSPEQISGNDPALGPRTDVYALGVMLFEMISGGPPFTGTNDFQVLSRHLLDAAPMLGVHRDDLAGTALEALVGEMLSKAPEDRPASMHEVVERLDAARRELEEVGIEDAAPLGATPEPVVADAPQARLTHLIDRIRVAAPESDLGLVIGRLPGLVDLPSRLAQQVLWGTLSRTLLDTQPTSATFELAATHLRLLLEAALELGTRPEGGSTLLVASACLTDLMRLADTPRQKKMVLALQPLRAHARFPEKALPDWARVSSSGTWQAVRPKKPTVLPPPIPRLEDMAAASVDVPTPVPESVTLAEKLGQPLTLESIKSVLTHEITLFGRNKGNS